MTQSRGIDSTTDVTRHETRGVAESAKEAGGQVAQTAAEQARQVAAETSRQTRDLLNEGRYQVREQARTGQHRVAEGVSAIADELREMATNTTRSGVATDVVRQAADRLNDIAAWLSKREPGDLVNELRSWARQHPGTFLVGAAAAGVIAGRLTGGAVAAARDSSGSRSLTGDRSTYPTGRPDYGTGVTGYQSGQTGYVASPTYATGEPGYASGQPGYATGEPGYGTDQPTSVIGESGVPPQRDQATTSYDDTSQDPYRQQGGQVSP